MFNFLLQCDYTFVMFFLMHHFAHIIIIDGTDLKHLCLIKLVSHNDTYVLCGVVWSGAVFFYLRNLSATLIKSILCHILLILLMLLLPLLLLLLHLKFMVEFKSILFDKMRPISIHAGIDG